MITSSTEEDREAAKESTQADPEQQRLEEKTEVLRARLAQTLDSLYKRKQSVLDLTRQALKYPVALAGAGLGLLVMLIGWASISSRRAKRLTKQLKAAGISPQKKRRSKRTMGGKIVRGVVVNLSIFALTQLAKYGLEQYRLKKQKDAKDAHPGRETAPE